MTGERNYYCERCQDRGTIGTTRGPATCPDCGGRPEERWFEELMRPTAEEPRR